jgi:hypothetical protein
MAIAKSIQEGITMKKIIALLITLVSLQIFSFAAAAAKSESITFYEPITVASSTLPAGTYTVSWTEGSTANVTFSQGKKNVATVPATVVVKKNPDTAIQASKSETGKKLQEIDFKNASLNFRGTETTRSGN